MDESERAQTKRWVETWRKAGPSLAAILCEVKESFDALLRLAALR